MSSFHSKMRM